MRRPRPGVERARHADEAETTLEAFERWRKVPDTALIDSFLFYQLNLNHPYRERREHIKLHYGVTAAVLIERGYDPDDAADLERRRR